MRNSMQSGYRMGEPRLPWRFKVLAGAEHAHLPPYSDHALPRAETHAVARRIQDDDLSRPVERGAFWHDLWPVL